MFADYLSRYDDFVSVASEMVDDHVDAEDGFESETSVDSESSVELEPEMALGNELEASVDGDFEQKERGIGI